MSRQEKDKRSFPEQLPNRVAAEVTVSPVGRTPMRRAYCSIFPGRMALASFT